jgi:hypothetical protein
MEICQNPGELSKFLSPSFGIKLYFKQFYDVKRIRWVEPMIPTDCCVHVRIFRTVSHIL